MSETVIQQKIEALLDLARSEASEAKDRIADDLSEIIYVEGAPFSPRELDIATDILRKLVHEAEVAVRQRMADRLARDRRAPRDLVLALANDDILVARPVLAMSAALRDRDLIEIVRHKTKQHQLAVAAREDLGKGVSAVIAETADTDVVAELLKNPSARIAEATYAYIAERSQKETELQAPLLKREDLPGNVAARMYGWVASELRTVIEQKYKVAAHILDAPLIDSLSEVAAEHGPEIPWDEAERGLAEAIKAERLNDPMVLVRLLKTGHVSLFEALVARYLNVGIRLARRILYQPDGRALAVACRAGASSGQSSRRCSRRFPPMRNWAAPGKATRKRVTRPSTCSAASRSRKAWISSASGACAAPTCSQVDGKSAYWPPNSFDVGIE